MTDWLEKKKIAVEYDYSDSSIRHLFRYIYYAQNQKSKLRGHNKPSYSLDELIAWAKKQKNFRCIYNNWVKAGYKSNSPLKPSVDRLDNNYGYTFNNIRLVTLKENIIAGNKNRKNKTNSNGHPVYMMDAKGNILARFCSVHFASIIMNVAYQSIQSSLKTGRKTKGYLWRKLEEKK